jgi:hypothetical protein
MDCHASAFEPFTAWRLRFPSAAGQCLFNEVQALIESITADHAIVWKRPDAMNWIESLDHVPAPHRERIDPELTA